MEEISKGLKVLKLLKQVMGAIKHNVQDQFKDMQLTAPQGMVAGTIAHYGKMKVSDLGEKLGLSNSTISGIIDRLEKQGVVERNRSEEDRRVVYVDVTEYFRKNSEEHLGHMGKMMEKMMQKATTEELETIIKGLETLKRLIENQKEQQ
jgi:DNA-binding MarR family transcriptional regulator